mmetsp:Transcript_16423/g.62390  ORF Transcript_16423/g.62390 Transcript_16423/m.62390 type:complete len:411 (-) Transcript_16423:400-1632(-)
MADGRAPGRLAHKLFRVLARSSSEGGCRAPMKRPSGKIFPRTHLTNPLSLADVDRLWYRASSALIMDELKSTLAARRTRWIVDRRAIPLRFSWNSSVARPNTAASHAWSSKGLNRNFGHCAARAFPWRCPVGRKRPLVCCRSLSLTLLGPSTLPEGRAVFGPGLWTPRATGCAAIASEASSDVSSSRSRSSLTTLPMCTTAVLFAPSWMAAADTGSGRLGDRNMRISGIAATTGWRSRPTRYLSSARPRFRINLSSRLNIIFFSGRLGSVPRISARTCPRIWSCSVLKSLYRLSILQTAAPLCTPLTCFASSWLLLVPLCGVYTKVSSSSTRTPSSSSSSSCSSSAASSPPSSSSASKLKADDSVVSTPPACARASVAWPSPHAPERSRFRMLGRKGSSPESDTVPTAIS